MNRSALGVLLAAAMLATACSSDGDSGGEGGSQGNGEEPFLIMVSGGADAGPFTDQLVTGVLSAQAAVNVVNEGGGMAGRQVELLESPDNADPARALTALREQIAKRKPDAYLISVSANVSAAVAQTLAREDIIFMDSGNVPETNDPENNPFAFHLAAAVPDLVATFIPEFERSGYKNIGILHGNSAYGAVFGETAESVFAEQGYEVVANVEYDAEALDMTAEIERLRAADPDVVVFNGYGAPVGYVLDGLQTIGWDVPLIGETSVTASPQATTPAPDGLLGTDAVANLLIQVPRSMVPDEAGPDTAQMVEAMAEAGEITAPLTNALNFDAIMLLDAAADAAESTDNSDIVEALYDNEVTSNASTGLYAEITYSADNHDSSVPADTFIFVPPAPVREGQLVPDEG